MGYRCVEGEGPHVEVRPVAQVLEHVYQRGQLTDENLMTALMEGPLPEREEPAQQRTFSRRSADRQIRQELVAGAENAQ